MQSDPETKQFVRMVCSDRIRSTRFVRDFTADLLTDAGELGWPWYRAYLYSDLETEAN